MLNTNDDTSRAKADDGKRSVVTTSNMKQRPVKNTNYHFPGVRKLSPPKSAKTFFQTSDMDALAKDRERQARLAQNVEPAQPAADQPTKKPSKVKKSK